METAITERKLFVLIFIFLWIIFLGGCALKTGEFAKAELLDTKLTTGLSTKADVLLILGEPSGPGDAIIPTDQTKREIWYYENFDTSLMGSEQQILLVFFKRDTFDGYLWFSNNVDIDLW